MDLADCHRVRYLRVCNDCAGIKKKTVNQAPRALMDAVDRDAVLREHLLELLGGGGAHLSVDEAIAGFPPEHWGSKVKGVAHTPWELLEHLRICQWDILGFSRSADHQSPPFPEGYWPSHSFPPHDLAPDQSIAAFRKDANAMRALIADVSNDLLKPLPWGTGQTLAREAILVADHNAYHLGQFVIVRRALGV